MYFPRVTPCCGLNADKSSLGLPGLPSYLQGPGGAGLPLQNGKLLEIWGWKDLSGGQGHRIQSPESNHFL